MVNYILIGLIFQWLMNLGAEKVSPENSFTHGVRISLIFIWPLGVVGFIVSFIKSSFNKK